MIERKLSWSEIQWFLMIFPVWCLQGWILNIVFIKWVLWWFFTQDKELPEDCVEANIVSFWALFKEAESFCWSFALIFSHFVLTFHLQFHNNYYLRPNICFLWPKISKVTESKCRVKDIKCWLHGDMILDHVESKCEVK